MPIQTTSYRPNSLTLVGITNSSDYSPFGVQLDGRTVSKDQYHFGFQNQEKDDEIKGAGNSVNYNFRMHDPRVGRFFAVDPLGWKYPYNSTYAFSENRVLDGIDLEGTEYTNITVYRFVDRKQIDDHELVEQTTVKYYEVYQKNIHMGKSELSYTVRITNVTSVEVDRNGKQMNEKSYTYGAIVLPGGKESEISKSSFENIVFSKDQMCPKFKEVLKESIDYNKTHSNTYFEDKAETNKAIKENVSNVTDGAGILGGAAIKTKGYLPAVAVGAAISVVAKLVNNAVEETVNTNPKSLGQRFSGGESFMKFSNNEIKNFNISKDNVK
ncbi:MAG: hypothetical protein FGM14_16895 [Flavobacteriales bacterium]|nr:hypothetical protein [Flavobacteriales bacterium]